MRILSKMRVDLDKMKDALGVCCIFGVLIVGLWLAHGFGLQLGGDELMRLV